MPTEEGNRLLLTDAFWRLAQRVFRGVMTDAVYWTNAHGSYRIAFVGNPLKVAQMFKIGFDDDDSGGADASLSQQIGHAVQSAMSIPLTQRDMSADWVRGPLHLFDLLDRLGGQVSWEWSTAHNAPIGDEGVRVGLIPEPGYPWPADGDRYWSAKQKRWLSSKEPGWLIEVEGREKPGEMVYGVNPCLVFPPDETKTAKGGPVCGEIAGFEWPIMAAHSMSLVEPGETGVRHHKQLDMAISGINDCGGLLFPSLSVGPIPATNFGPIVLVAHLELVLASLLPYRRQERRRPCWVYGTDAWTKTTGSLMRGTAVELFDELHGDDDWMYSGYMATLGVPSTTKQLFGEYVDPLTSTKALASSLRKRMKRWSPDMDLEDFLEASTVDSDSRDAKYAYCEAKAREVVRLEEFPFLVAPEEMKDTVRTFVRGVGYKGKVVLADSPDFFGDPGSDESKHALYQWAWQVADIVRELRPVVEIET